MTLPKSVEFAIKTIEQSGFEAYVVGGCVRDSLLGKTPDDWDITTSALPMDIQNIFKNHQVFPTGINHGTVTVILFDTPHEVTTYRIDGSYKDGRHPSSVTFSKSLTQDLSRRDFTINAMAYSPKDGLIDPFGGKVDLEAKIIRTVGNPQDRFSEDALRIMRAIRFSAVLGFKIEPQTRRALFDCSNHLCSIAPERICAELNKILLSENSGPILTEFFSVMAKSLFGDYAVGESVNDSLSEFFVALNVVSKSLCKRLAIFLLGSSKVFSSDPVILGTRFFSRMKYDNKTRNQCLLLLKNIDRTLLCDRISLRLLIKDLGAQAAKDLVEVKKAMAKTQKSILFLKEVSDLLDDILNSNDCCHIKDLNINGTDLKTELLLSGAEIGKSLDFLLDAVIHGSCKNEKPELIKYMKNKMLS